MRNETPESTEGAQAGASPDHTTDSPDDNSEHSATTATPNFRVNLFAEKHTLSQWFPQIQDDENDSWRIYLSRRSQALLLQIVLVSVIFATNLGLTIFATVRYGSENGVGTLYKGDCGKVKTLNQWMHLLINLLSTGMLSASNYCMQLQVAPTRADVDRAHQARAHEVSRAHQEGTWLDIGVPSLRNLRYISNWRRLAWFLLAFSSVPIHLIYNSAIFQALASNDYTIAVVKNSFVDGSPWNLATAEANRRGDWGWDEDRVNPRGRNYTEIIQSMQDSVLSDTWEELNVSACFALYNDYFTPQGNGVIFVSNDTADPEADSLLMYVSIVPRLDDWAKNMWALGNGSSNVFVAKSPDLPVTTWFLGPRKYAVSHCRVQSPDTITNDCRFEFSPYLMAAVCALNFFKASVMLCIWVTRRWQNPQRGDAEKEILCTLGDAIASFMRRPDATTADMGLSGKDDFVRRRPWSARLVKLPLVLNREPREWEGRQRTWFEAASIWRWVILLVL